MGQKWCLWDKNCHFGNFQIKTSFWHKRGLFDTTLVFSSQKLSFRHNFGHYDTHMVILIQKWLFRDKGVHFEYEIHIMNGHLVTKMVISTKMSHFDSNIQSVTNRFYSSVSSESGFRIWVKMSRLKILDHTLKSMTSFLTLVINQVINFEFLTLFVQFLTNSRSYYMNHIY